MGKRPRDPNFDGALECMGAARARLDYLLIAGASGQYEEHVGPGLDDLERTAELIAQAIEFYKSARPW